jgi:hypothetical protein
LRTTVTEPLLGALVTVPLVIFMLARVFLEASGHTMGRKLHIASSLILIVLVLLFAFVVSERFLLLSGH